MALAEEAHVPVNCQVSLGKASGVEPMDMTVLLGNCLENALEALRRLPEGWKHPGGHRRPGESSRSFIAVEPFVVFADGMIP